MISSSLHLTTENANTGPHDHMGKEARGTKDSRDLKLRLWGEYSQPERRMIKKQK